MRTKKEWLLLLAFNHPTQYAEYRYCALDPAFTSKFTRSQRVPDLRINQTHRLKPCTLANAALHNRDMNGGNQNAMP